MDILEWLETHPFVRWSMLVLAAAFLVVVFYLFARMLLQNINQAGDYDPMTTLMVILGTVTLVSLVGALFTQAESAYTIAATGVGAFAGTLTARAQSLPPKPPADPFDPLSKEGEK